MPVRFVLPRVLLPIDLTVCLLAGVAMAAVQKTRAPLRVAVIILAAGGITFSALRASDLTYQMLNDSRYGAERWLARNLQPGDVVGYYGSRRKLPHMRTDVVLKEAHSFTSPESILTTPDFIISIPQEINEPVHERNITGMEFARLLDGTLGYRQVLAVQGPAMWSRLLVAPGVNPPVRVFASNRILGRLPDSSRPDPH